MYLVTEKNDDLWIPIYSLEIFIYSFKVIAGCDIIIIMNSSTLFLNINLDVP